jgi:hypothetical protein
MRYIDWFVRSVDVLGDVFVSIDLISYNTKHTAAIFIERNA